MTAEEKRDLKRIVELLSTPWTTESDAAERIGRAQAVAETMLDRAKGYTVDDSPEARGACA